MLLALLSASTPATPQPQHAQVLQQGHGPNMAGLDIQRAADRTELLADSAQRNCMRLNSRSQWGEDNSLIPGLHAVAAGSIGEPSFVEIGALDGYNLSNTFALERCLGWRGLLIEGNPTNFARLNNNVLTGLRNASKVAIEHSAVCNQASGGFVDFTVSGNAVAGVPRSFNPDYAQRWARANHPEHTVRVACRPMSTILADHRLADDSTFLSLDVEGAEVSARRCRLGRSRGACARVLLAP